MRISMKGDYGARAMVDLAQRFGQGSIQSAEIAARQEIPEPYLDQLLALLRRAGLIRSVRGPKGGHSLARRPEEITLCEVVTALEGSLAPGPLRDDNCSPSVVSVQRDIWAQIQQQTVEILSGVTLADLVKRQSEREAQAMYHI